MARLENVIMNMVELFLEYAGDEGKKRQLSKAELEKMLTDEIKSPALRDKIKADDIEEALKDLDKNHDNQVNFREFCKCVSNLAKAYYQLTKSGKKGNQSAEEQA